MDQLDTEARLAEISALPLQERVGAVERAVKELEAALEETAAPDDELL